jgi:hypothetical protein
VVAAVITLAPTNGVASAALILLLGARLSEFLDSDDRAFGAHCHLNDK